MCVSKPRTKETYTDVYGIKTYRKDYDKGQEKLWACVIV